MVFTLKLTFKTDENAFYTMTVPKADGMVTDLTVDAAMDGILGSGVISTAKGNLAGKAKAELVSKDTYTFRY